MNYASSCGPLEKFWKMRLSTQFSVYGFTWMFT